MSKTKLYLMPTWLKLFAWHVCLVRVRKVWHLCCETCSSPNNASSWPFTLQMAPLTSRGRVKLSVSSARHHSSVLEPGQMPLPPCCSSLGGVHRTHTQSHAHSDKLDRIWIFVFVIVPSMLQEATSSNCRQKSRRVTHSDPLSKSGQGCFVVADSIPFPMFKKRMNYNRV